MGYLNGTREELEESIVSTLHALSGGFSVVDLVGRAGRKRKGKHVE